ncbi:hypothetical protein [Enterococcus sp. LJL90]
MNEHNEITKEEFEALKKEVSDLKKIINFLQGAVAGIKRKIR